MSVYIMDAEASLDSFYAFCMVGSKLFFFLTFLGQHITLNNKN